MKVQDGPLPVNGRLSKGQKLAGGFSVIDVVDLSEIRATGIWAKHDKCGVEVFHVLNDDSENLFAFATAPDDNTGAAHILEHSTLCGSEHYPLKDTFLVLAQGSLQTFLNAWTFPDKTVYPASSVNEHDYFNLMSVYGDAVFRPLLSEWAFMQEGHRYEFTKDDNKLSITGVVYNEMKGAYSSLDAYSGLWSIKAVLPDTPYGFESGGDPQHIPQLSWEGLKEFHRSHYSPANCRIFLAGNIPTEKQLSFLNDHFFSSLEGGTASPLIARQKRWTAPKEFHIPCPAGGETKSTVFLSWLCSDTIDTAEGSALAALAGILLSHDGSPLYRALTESGLGEDVTPVSGFESEIGETVFVAGLRGVSGKINKMGKKIESFILNELRRLVTEGIPIGEIEATLLSMEFSEREIERSHGPFSLVWMQRSLRTWLYGGKPWERLLRAPLREKIKQNLTENNRYFESLIQKYLLDNPHRALVMLEPQKDFLPKQEAQLAETLAKLEQNLNTADKKRIAEKASALEKFQSEGDSPEALATIPHLSLSDLSAEPELIHRSLEDIQGIPALYHDLYTNGISYIDLAFPLDILPPEDYPWLPFFTQAAISMGLPGMDYAEVSSLLARTVGNFSTRLFTGSASPVYQKDQTSALDNLAGRDWVIYRVKCLDEKTETSLDIVQRLILESDFSDTRRLRDLVLEMKNDIRSGFAPSGSSYASIRANRYTSHPLHTKETWSGITQLEFAHLLAETDIAQIAAKLCYLRDSIAAGGLIANLTGSAEALKANGALLAERFSSLGSPRQRNPSHLPEIPPLATPRSPLPVKEVFASPSLQIGFAAMSLRAAAFDTPEDSAEEVLAHQLSTGTLWETIRMRGGAYGASASSNSREGCFSLYTYRDPHPLRSLESFSAILKDSFSITKDSGFQENLVKAIIGCYAHTTRPLSPEEKGITDFFRYILRIEDDLRRRSLKQLIAVSAEDISTAFGALASQLASESANQVIITGIKDAEQAAKALGTEVRMLPV
jgi:Zn-dependent M16 (insulinase) family peptidase